MGEKRKDKLNAHKRIIEYVSPFDLNCSTRFLLTSKLLVSVTIQTMITELLFNKIKDFISFSRHTWTPFDLSIGVAKSKIEINGIYFLFQLNELQNDQIIEFS